MRNVGIYVFDEVEVLDFAGPFEVFSTAACVSSRLTPHSGRSFEVFTIGQSRAEIRTRGGLIVEPHYGLEDHPKIDVLLIPGGVVAAELENQSVVSWIAAQAKTAEVTASVCTGAFLLGRAGVLTGKRATTHWEDIANLRVFLPDSQIVEAKRWVDEGKVISSAGITAGLDMSLHLVARLGGRDLAVKTARQLDYEWRDDA